MKDIEIRELFRNKEKYGDQEVVVHDGFEATEVRISWIPVHQ